MLTVSQSMNSSGSSGSLPGHLEGLPLREGRSSIATEPESPNRPAIPEASLCKPSAKVSTFEVADPKENSLDT